MSTRYTHGYAHDVFVSDTHKDNQPDAGLRWVEKFTQALKARLEIVSGKTVDVWRDEERLGAADRFDESIATAIKKSAVLLVVLSPAYFYSGPCQEERQAFYKKVALEAVELDGTKARVVKVAKFRVDLERYPPDLRQLLEHKFYVELPGPKWREFHLCEETAIREHRYHSRVDDVAQEIDGLLTGLELSRKPARPTQNSRRTVYLAEGTSDIEPQRDELRRQLLQLGFDVQPTQELRLVPTREIRDRIASAIGVACLAIHPVGGFYGLVPEGAEGQSLVQIQLEVARCLGRHADVARLIWVPEGLVVHEEAQRAFLNRIRTEFAGDGFELLERPFRVLQTRVIDRLRSPEVNRTAAVPSGVYLICDNADRATAKEVRSFIFNQRYEVEWTPIDLGDLATDEGHHKRLRRNHTHVVIHGATSEAWLQDRIHELIAIRQAGARPLQAIYLTSPRREDKVEIAVRDIAVVEAYPPATIGATLGPLLPSRSGT